MSTVAQVAANRQNSHLSTGPKTEAGRAKSSKNHTKHALSGAFRLLEWEDEQDFQDLHESLRQEYRPVGESEQLLLAKMAEHHWLSQRAMLLQTRLLELEMDMDPEDEKRFALYLRYQTTNDRAFSRFLNDLLKVQKERRNREIGFELQKAKKEREQERAEARKAAEERKQELHRYAVATSQTKFALAQKKLNADQSVENALKDFLDGQKAA